MRHYLAAFGLALGAAFGIRTSLKQEKLRCRERDSQLAR
jgi:predicted outer membrane lipoprotein